VLRPWKIGRLFGIPLEVNFTFLLLLGFVLFSMGGLAGLIVTLAVFASVVLHELGHALLARRLGVPVAGIELSFFGGAAKLVGQPRSAGDEIAIAAAGPAVSFLLAGLSHGLAILTGIHAFGLLASVNLVIGLFNLMPALPMDGGRILRALLSRRYGFLGGTRIAITVARVLAVGAVILGVATGQLMLAVVAVVVWLMGNAELRMASVRGYGEEPVAELVDGPRPLRGPVLRVWIVGPSFTRRW
jgi:Zn-dependent protease